ncbi:MAG TPA: hypothetical protein VK666_30605 [Chryseolinea sp.]|nr:hypothetical protein [Chryseolinea sp.]
MIISTAEFLESERDRLIHDLLLALYPDKSLLLHSLVKDKPLAFDLAEYADAIGFRESIVEKMVKEGLVNPAGDHAYALSPKGRDIVESGGWLNVVHLRKSQQRNESELAAQRKKNALLLSRNKIVVSVIMYIAAFVAITLAILAYFKMIK